MKQIIALIAVRYANLLARGSALSGIRTQKLFYRDDATTSDIEEALRLVRGYNILTPARKIKSYIPYYVYSPRRLLEVDLIDMSGLRVGNLGVRFLLSGVDAFTKRGFLYPLRRKTGKAVLPAMKKLIEDAEKLAPVQRVSSDFGREFKNEHVQRLFKEKKIEHTHPRTSVHANMVEAFNYSIQRIIYLHMATTKSNSYVRDLPDILAAYNERYHRSILMTPAEAEMPKNHARVLALKLQDLVDRHGEQFWQRRKQGSKADGIDVGSLVLRVPKDRRGTAFMKSYKEQFQNQVFEVVEKKENLLHPLYTLEIMEKDGGPRRLKHKYYASELMCLREKIKKT